MADVPPVCDYEGSDYRTRFWEEQGRDYEDQVERFALRRLMAPSGESLIDIGAGFGRLADEYVGYRRVVLFDYSRTLLREAQRHLGDDPRYLFVAGNWYQMPFVSGLFQTLVQVRTIHHAVDVPALFRQLARIARPSGSYVLEFASKHNLKAILRYVARRQKWSPFSLQPVEFVELNFNFHPRWMNQQLQAAGFRPEEQLTVSHFRLPILKKLVPTGLLVGADRLIQPTGRWWQVSPSVFLRSQAPPNTAPASGKAFFACPVCLTPLPEPQEQRLTCPNGACGRVWGVQDDLYDFRDPLG
ncbi:MAG: class I SAM-dependent methyltransferase [Candidatus Promineifilaceae bacterium]